MQSICKVTIDKGWLIQEPRWSESNNENEAGEADQSVTEVNGPGQCTHSRCGPSPSLPRLWPSVPNFSVLSPWNAHCHARKKDLSAGAENKSLLVIFLSGSIAGEIWQHLVWKLKLLVTVLFRVCTHFENLNMGICTVYNLRQGI